MTPTTPFGGRVFFLLFFGCASFDFFQRRTAFFPLEFSDFDLRNF